MFLGRVQLYHGYRDYLYLPIACCGKGRKLTVMALVTYFQSTFFWPETE
jgi:hypothetical protein